MLFILLLLQLFGYMHAQTPSKVIAAMIFNRHGDRTPKVLGTTQLTNLGQSQVYSAGNYARRRYLVSSSPDYIDGISRDEYLPEQIYAAAPNENTLMSTAYAFLQALYPPTTNDIQILSNGTRQSPPLSGYQYVFIKGFSPTSPETIWIKGDENCPVASHSMELYSKSEEFKTTQASSQEFYHTLNSVLEPVFSYSEIGYQNAYSIFDYLNCEYMQKNSSIVSPQDLDRLRILANQHEFALAYTPENNDRSIGGMSLIGAVVSHLNQTASDPSHKLKLTYFAGSYDTFLAVFGLLGLSKQNSNFTGLPEYGSMISFELRETDTSNLVVRFNFRNGTNDEMQSYALLDNENIDMPWEVFVDKMGKVEIRGTQDWCVACGLNTGFCTEFIKEQGNQISLVAAGIIGAASMFLTLGALTVGPRIIRRRRDMVKLNS